MKHGAPIRGRKEARTVRRVPALNPQNCQRPRAPVQFRVPSQPVHWGVRVSGCANRGARRRSWFAKKHKRSWQEIARKTSFRDHAGHILHRQLQPRMRRMSLSDALVQVPELAQHLGRAVDAEPLGTIKAAKTGNVVVQHKRTGELHGVSEELWAFTTGSDRPFTINQTKNEENMGTGNLNEQACKADAMLVHVRSEFDIALLIKFEGLVRTGNQPCSEGELRAGYVRRCRSERHLLRFSRIRVRNKKMSTPSGLEGPARRPLVRQRKRSSRTPQGGPPRSAPKKAQVFSDGRLGRQKGEMGHAHRDEGVVQLVMGHSRATRPAIRWHKDDGLWRLAAGAPAIPPARCLGSEHPYSPQGRSHRELKPNQSMIPSLSAQRGTCIRHWSWKVHSAPAAAERKKCRQKKERKQDEKASGNLSNGSRPAAPSPFSWQGVAEQR